MSYKTRSPTRCLPFGSLLLGNRAGVDGIEKSCGGGTGGADGTVEGNKNSGDRGVDSGAAGGGLGVKRAIRRAPGLGEGCAG